MHHRTDLIDFLGMLFEFFCSPFFFVLVLLICYCHHHHREIYSAPITMKWNISALQKSVKINIKVKLKRYRATVEAVLTDVKSQTKIV